MKFRDTEPTMGDIIIWWIKGWGGGSILGGLTPTNVTFLFSQIIVYYSVQYHGMW